MEGIYHFVYRITNNINSKYYIGVHSTYNIDDGYMGSGTLLRKAVKKYGVENFTREILFSCITKKEAFDKELNLVNEAILNDELCYNLVIGGNLGPKSTEYKRAFFRIGATPLIVTPEKRLNEQYKFVFLRNEPGIIDWRKQVSDRYNSRDKKRKGVEFQFTFENRFIDEFDSFLAALSKMYNNKFTHNNARQHIERLFFKGLLNCFKINQVAWQN